MAMLSNLDLIRRVPLFSMLTNDQAQAIADSVVKRRFRRGEIIVEHGQEVERAVHPAHRPCPRPDRRPARPRGHPRRAATGRLRRRDEPDRQRSPFGHRSRRGADRHAGARPRRVLALPAGELQPGLRDHAWASCSACAPPTADRVAWLLDVHGRVARRCSTWPRPTAAEDHPATVSRARIWPRSSARRARWSAGHEGPRERGMIEETDGGRDPAPAGD